MAVTPADVKALAPELATESDVRLSFFIDLCSDSINTARFGSKADKGTTLLAAHFATVANRQGAAGAIASESLGDWSRSYSASPSTSQLGTTGYGEMFLLLSRSLGVGVLVLSGGGPLLSGDEDAEG